MQKINSGGKLFAFDMDISAIERANIKFEEEINQLPPRIVLFNNSFSNASAICVAKNIQPVGILLDLGVSSKQLDSEQRGISYRINSPLDMRFGAESELTAKDILNSKSEEELAYIFRQYGEEPKSKLIAKRIVEIRRFSTLETTFDLKKIIEDLIPPTHHFKTLSRVFQSIRIEVNRELEVLSKTLKEIINIMQTGGRIVVISYHSLEDRIVKNIFKEFSYSPKQNKYAQQENKINILSKNFDNFNNIKANSNNPDINAILIDNEHNKNDIQNTYVKTNAIIMPKIKLISEKPIIPSIEEIKRNPRARSAKMRVAEKI
jgi:16S rRNA (cytosine1402-N4)-methyltransferase